MSISINVTAPGAIPDLTTLIGTVSDWLDRDDITNRIPVFIQMAEAMFNRELRHPQMERSVLLQATQQDTPLPSDYLAMRAIFLDTSPNRPLRAISPTAERIDWDGTTGTPVAYALVSGGIRLVPAPDTSTLLALDYYALIDALSVYAPSNWMLEQHPDAYLYAALFNAEAFLDNSTRAAQWKGLLDQTMQAITRQARNDRYGAGPLSPSTVNQVSGAKC